MARKDYEKKYTKPDLREKVKEDIKASDKGGRKGQWSARKSQLLVQEYEKKGGDYKKEKNNKAANSLKKWNDQDWQTRDKDTKAHKGEKTKRYLPKKVWDLLTDKEKDQADRSKLKASKNGQQKVDWPVSVKKAFKKAGYDDDSDVQYEKFDVHVKAKELNIAGRSKMRKQDLEKAVRKELQRIYNRKSKKELYEEAKKKDIRNRSKYNKQKLIEALVNAG